MNTETIRLLVPVFAAVPGGFVAALGAWLVARENQRGQRAV
jgi:hypothetical protein